MFQNRNENESRCKPDFLRRALCLAALALALTTANAQEIIFSLDAGSDTEISDPNADGDEWLDPGDAYSSLMTLGAYSQDGVVDDASFLGVDVAPDGGLGTGAIPFGVACTATPSTCVASYFDLDGIDAINVDLAPLIDPDAPLDGPIAKSSFSSSEQRCINDVQYVQVSFDDDNADSWIGGTSAAPTNTTSPGGSTFGSAARANEIVALTLAKAGSGSSTSHTITSRGGLAAESTVHTILFPNPTTAQPNDDDVDALDVIGDAETCPVFLFGPDHEADYGLERGGIYQYDTRSPAGSSSLLIRATVHFGLLRSDIDIDAFEFVWMDDADGNPALAVLFSVDDDDPQTLTDEQGALSPGMIYGSFLDGTFFPVARVAWNEDVDAISTSATPSSDIVNP